MDSPSLRILDANANRAREALRVLEDYARFSLNHEPLCEELKHFRHDLTDILKPHLTQAILHRDVQGDVGAEIKTPAEAKRESIDDVIIAAGKRLTEALRVLEEVLKTLDSPAASRTEKLRYSAYALEQKLAYTLRPKLFDHVSLYVLITESICKRPWLDAAKLAIEGGADCLQLREKNLDSGELLNRARQLVNLCHQHNILCIINDRPDIALLSGADGLHLGQHDLPPTEARKLIGPRLILGLSTHNLEQAKQAVLDSADYIGIGPIFPSQTKPREILPGLPFARQIAHEIHIPAVAIAGITEQNVDEVLACGIKAIAVTAAVVGHENIRAAAAALKQKLLSPPPGGRTFLSATTDLPSPGYVKKTFRRHLPHWTLQGSTYFLTFCLAQGELSPPERTLLLQHLRAGHGQFYSLLSAVIMPDHIHILLRPNDGIELNRIVKGIKGASSRKINELRKSNDPLWQEDYWDRIIRDQNELDEKLNYMLNNPAKRDLVDDPWDYEWWYIDREVSDGGQECPPS